ncbi:hypothetical protein DRQ00_06400 [candidate division KSB1 bacterium]|nr:MAG: hypothetical protein DRQ00_06400 [candidate division KSB1 bacterium]
MVKSKIQKIIWPLVSVLFVVLIWRAHVNLDKIRLNRSHQEEIVYLPDGETLRWASLGYQNVVADILWIQSVLYFGRNILDEDNPYYEQVLERKKRLAESEKDKIHPASFQHVTSSPNSCPEFVFDSKLQSLLFNFENRGLVNYIYPLLDRVTTIDPHFKYPYIFGGMYVLMETGEIDKAVALLEKGKKNNPEDWEIPYYLGFVYLFYKHNLKLAIENLKTAIRSPQCPGFVLNLLAAISKKIDYQQTLISYLKGIANSTTDKLLKNKIRKTLEKLKE